MRLEDKVAIMTGSGRGMGRTTAARLAEEGAAVVVAEIDKSSAVETAAAITGAGRRALAISTDVTDQAQVERLVVKTVETFGRLDILVNNAAILGRTPLLEITV